MNMKKLLTLILALTMVLTLCACGASGGEGGSNGKLDGLCVGFGRENITPDFSVGLGGYSDNETRRSEGYVDYIYSTCIAMTEGETTILLFTIDNIAMNQSSLDKLRKAVSPATGIPEEHIYALATHSHSAPAVTTSDAEGQKYSELFYNAAVKAAETALADRATSTLQAATPTIEGMNFVRHYKLSNGTYAGSNFGSTTSGYKEHTYEVNHEMILVNFPREGKDAVMLVNWAAHPANPYNVAIGYLNISADHPGWCRDQLEKLVGNTKVAYFNGASGDVVPDSQIKEINHGLNAKQYGEKLAEMLV